MEEKENEAKLGFVFPRVIVYFYLGMTMKGRMRVAEKVISKMGRKKITAWMKL